MFYILDHAQRANTKTLADRPLVEGYKNCTFFVDRSVGTWRKDVPSMAQNDQKKAKVHRNGQQIRHRIHMTTASNNASKDDTNTWDLHFNISSPDIENAGLIPSAIRLMR